MNIKFSSSSEHTAAQSIIWKPGISPYTSLPWHGGTVQAESCQRTLVLNDKNQILSRYCLHWKMRKPSHAKKVYLVF